MSTPLCKFPSVHTREPNWARIPPHVTTYPNPPDFFRRTPADHFTAPPNGREGYSEWWMKWHTEQPNWRDEHYRMNDRTPVMRKIGFNPGTLKQPYRESMEKPRPDYLRQGLPGTETTRARGLHKIHTATGNDLLYPHSNAMTSTQYQKPVPTIYGPMKRPNVYGVDTQHNRHGFMSFDDHYF